MSLVGFSKDLPDVFKDPFRKDKVEGINLRTFTYNSKTVWVGRVTFKNGDTKGTQEFEHKDFTTIVKQIEDFINSL